jgi:hypothetical protein
MWNPNVRLFHVLKSEAELKCAKKSACKNHSLSSVVRSVLHVLASRDFFVIFFYSLFCAVVIVLDRRVTVVQSVLLYVSRRQVQP